LKSDGKEHWFFNMANHASHAALPYPIKGARYTVYVPLLDADGDPTAQTTPDTEISEDNAAATDAAEEVSATSGMDGMGMLTFTGAETDCSMLAANFKAASGPKATLMTLYPRVLAEVGTGTLSAGSAGGGTLGTLLAYDVTGCFIKTTGGTGGGGTGGANNQARKIVTYNTSTGAFTVSPNWETTPSTDTTYAILLPEGVSLGMLKMLLSNGPHGGTAAVLTLERIVVASATSNEPAMKLTGNGTASGLLSTGGATGHGAKFTGGATSGSGIHSSAPTSGYGIYAVSLGDNGSGFHGQGFGDGAGMLLYGGTNGDGLACQGYKAGGGIVAHGGADGGAGSGAGPGMFANASATGPGMQISGGATATNTGHGLVIAGDVGDAAGLYIRSSGAYSGVIINAGATGHGIALTGGTTSGDGLNITTTSGHGVSIAATGTSKHGVTITGGNGGTSDGLKLTAGTGGVGLRLDTLTATGAVALSSTLTVTGATTLTGAVSATNASNDIRGIDVSKLGNDSTALTRLKQMFGATRLITVDSATFTPTTTQFETDHTTDDAGRYTEQVLYGLSGDNAGVATPITGYAFANSKVKLTVEALPAAPSNGHTFLIMGRIEQ
jgi:hypothetical protein